MIFVTVLLVLCLSPQIQNVKVMIDGTIDFGPNWNFKYKVKPMNGFEPRKTISDNSNVLLNNKNIDLKVPEQGNGAGDTEIVEDNKNGARTAIVADDSSDGKNSEERFFEVTKLYKFDVAKGAMFTNPRKIKHEAGVIQFVDHIKNESLKMFDTVQKKTEDKEFVKKITALKERYANKFGDFENETKNHTIRTTLGSKNVIVNTIEYSNRLLNRLVNRFNIDVEDNKLRNGFDISKAFKDEADNMKIVAYEDACRKFQICRVGHEFTDHIGDLIKELLEQNDLKIKTGVKAVVIALKNADLSKIMDEETQGAFRDGLSILEELTPFELRVLLMAYKLIIDNRHKPFLDKDPENPWVKATVAMFNVIEGFNEKIIIDEHDWKTIKKDFLQSLNGKESTTKDVAKKFVNLVQNQIEALDASTANDFKDKLKLCMWAKTLRINLSTFVQFQPFII